ncbi:CBO0543 family protein [Cytobacillus sp. Hz8]|uniref:CBO0543 family protein n=1 Tax=Cytobacillus sp. Hz8 TaxID=3347168 RepID=UPI0035D9076E
MRKRRDKVILILCLILTTLSLIAFIPKHKIREAQVAFLFKQVVTWLFGLFVVEKNLISYPTRLFFKKANKSSFSFEYYIYPALCALFNVYYPEKSNKTIKFLYNLLYPSFITIFEILAVKYTSLIRYNKWKWYWSFITLWITNYISRIYHRWFFKVECNTYHT